MLAKILATLLLLELLIYALFGLWLCTQQGWPPVLIPFLALALVIALRFVLVAASFALAYRYRGHRPADLSLRLRGRLRLFWLECFAFTALFTFLQPLERRLMRQVPRGVPRQAALITLLVPGIYCNAAVWWSARRHLIACGLPDVMAVNLEPTLASMEDLAAQLHRQIEDACRLTGAQRVVLVGHSMGGVIARACLRRMGNSDRVAKLITVGSPHHGSELARWAAVWASTGCGPDIPGWSKLNETGRNRSRVPIVSLFSWHDNLVAPQSSADTAQARQHRVQRHRASVPAVLGEVARPHRARRSWRPSKVKAAGDLRERRSARPKAATPPARS